MKITQRNLTIAMKEQDPSKRKAKLQAIALGIGNHGGVWQAARDEVAKLTAAGIYTALEKSLGLDKGAA